MAKIKKIEFVKSDAWPAFYSIMVNDKNFGHMVVNDVSNDETITNVFITDANDTIHNVTLRMRVNNTRKLFSLVKSFVSFIVGEDGIDLDNPGIKENV